MDTLPKLPKLNKAQFISSFVTTQQSNAKSYVEEGRVAALNWQLGLDSLKSRQTLRVYKTREVDNTSPPTGRPESEAPGSRRIAHDAR
ncbi:hypothetical protein E1B28_004435 [Marasmius oreades]|uniref:Uncharacterized protein n=1 Tax=Marasmius oreades TaxID=181124 RepID=A0A9P7UYJ8_9AGAR|nr:uncharacterized protein E1B28_004435 [Marasmius oreades]KAG7097044.1 hypothetical protein E1B28_004435 [Marasmius oreades]